MKKLHILFLFLLPSIYCTAQTYENQSALNFFEAHKLEAARGREALTERDINGSPYLQDDFVNGTIYTKSKQMYTDVPLRYNVYNDQIEFKNAHKAVLCLSQPESIERINIGNMNFVYVKYMLLKKVKSGFFEELQSGKASLYARKEVDFIKATRPAGYQDAQPPKFQPRPDAYYISVDGQPAVLVSGKKDLIEAFPDHQDEVTTFIKKNKVKPNKSDKLIALVEYYNSL